mmetsp:Transcript_5980/g.5140  ORF Transcript_5980/g.5140 Transcript_5980/m.5140 type:complete len:213 (+) Transcript_5980:43-681(+)
MTLKLSPVWSSKYLKDGFSPVCKFSKDANDSMIAAGYGDGKLLIYDYNNGITKEEINTHKFSVNDLDWSKSNNYLLSGSDDTLACIHDLNIQSQTNNDVYQKEVDRNIELDKSLVRVFKAHTHHVTSVAFDSNSSLVITGSTDRVSYLWDIRSSQYIHKIEDHAVEISGVDISQDGLLVLTAGKDGYVRLWETRTGLCLKTIKIDLNLRIGE